MSKKNNKRNKKLGRVAGGLSLGGNVKALGDVSVEDSSLFNREDNSRIAQTSDITETTVSTTMKLVI